MMELQFFSWIVGLIGPFAIVVSLWIFHLRFERRCELERAYLQGRLNEMRSERGALQEELLKQSERVNARLRNQTEAITILADAITGRR